MPRSARWEHPLPAAVLMHRDSTHLCFILLLAEGDHHERHTAALGGGADGQHHDTQWLHLCSHTTTLSAAAVRVSHLSESHDPITRAALPLQGDRRGTHGLPQ